MNPFPIVQGLAADYPTQTWLWGGLTKAAYANGDTLTGYCYPAKSTTALFQPAVSWYTANSFQTGYDQGQIVISISGAQSALLVAGNPFTLLVTWSPAGQPAKIAPIARVKLLVLPPPFPG